MRKFFTILILSFFVLTASNLKAQSSGSTDDQEQTQRIGIVVVDKKLTVSNAPYNAVLKIYSLVGAKVAEYKVTTSRQDFYLNLPVGYYIVRVGDQTVKIAVR
jgi:hypothetical protein